MGDEVSSEYDTWGGLILQIPKLFLRTFTVI